MYVCAPLLAWYEGPNRRAPDPLGLEVQMVVSFGVGSGSQTEFSAKVTQVPTCWVKCLDPIQIVAVAF